MAIGLSSERRARSISLIGPKTGQDSGMNSKLNCPLTRIPRIDALICATITPIQIRA
jgi:hypothetical protein